MNGDLSHLYDIKMNKRFLGAGYKDVELYYIGLKEKQRMSVVYDYGDNWIFNIVVSKICDDYKEKDFEVLSGIGYGIIDDCGGIWGLGYIYSGENTEWGEYDINDFNLEECNKKVDKV